MTSTVKVKTTTILWIIGFSMTLITTLSGTIWSVSENKARAFAEINSSISAIDRRLSRIEGLLSGQRGAVADLTKIQTTNITHN
jgi:hypothetical protein